MRLSRTELWENVKNRYESEIEKLHPSLKYIEQFYPFVLTIEAEIGDQYDAVVSLYSLWLHSDDGQPQVFIYSEPKNQNSFIES